MPRPVWTETLRARLVPGARALLALLLPPACAGCGVACEAALCPACRATLAWIPVGRCVGCQERAPRPGGVRCAACARRPSALDACLAACWFEGAAADWIRAYKYAAGGPWAAAVQRARLRALAVDLAVRAPTQRPDRVIPVPLHPRRLRARGFNPAGGVARALAVRRGLDWAPVALERIRDTPSQTGLDRSARARNVAGAFRARRALPPRVWLVDDVVTTGATLESAARALRRAGAEQVVGLCLARTPAAGRDAPG